VEFQAVFYNFLSHELQKGMLLKFECVKESTLLLPLVQTINFGCLDLKKIQQATAVLCIGSPKLRTRLTRETLRLRSLVVSSVTLLSAKDNTLKKVTTTSFHIIYNLVLTYFSTIQPSINQTVNKVL
jgi:hypothetical protein